MAEDCSKKPKEQNDLVDIFVNNSKEPVPQAHLKAERIEMIVREQGKKLNVTFSEPQCISDICIASDKPGTPPEYPPISYAKDGRIQSILPIILEQGHHIEMSLYTGRHIEVYPRGSS